MKKLCNLYLSFLLLLVSSRVAAQCSPISVSLSAASSTYCAATGGGITLTASQIPSLALSGISFTWMPGSMSGTAQALNPSVTTIYTVTAFGPGACTGSQTMAVEVFTNCCFTTTYTPLSTYTITGGPAITGPQIVSSDIVIQSGAALFLNGGEFLFLPNTGITIQSGGFLGIPNAHLRGCTAMWKGINVEDGGYMTSSNESLIEDALAAITVSNNVTSTQASILDIANTTFNKNYIDIDIGNYPASSNSYSAAFKISSSVFTCRDFTFSTTQWPTTATTGPLGLRVATSPTTGLAPPYGMLGVADATLKSPYAGQVSQIAIRCSTVGLTSPPVYSICLGSSTPASFNVFDAHETFIYAQQSNIGSINNTFQNTRFTSAANPASGSAIFHTTTGGTFNSLLDLSATGVSTGNRFWDCHRGVNGRNVFSFQLTNALFRSTQTNSNTINSFAPGNTGVLLTTNRFQYYMRYNEFTNLHNGINVPLVSGPSTLIPAPTPLNICCFGIYAANLTVLQNTFATGGYWSSYMHQAVNITAAIVNTMAIAPGGNVSPYVIGATIQDNVIEQALRGIEVNGLPRFRVRAEQNTISLNEDNIFYLSQRGIGFSNCAAGDNYGRSIISGNFLKSVGASPPANGFANLIYCDNNPGIPALASPGITCNDVRESYNGFTFVGPNPGTQWAGNEIQDLTRGMYLFSGGVIGQQGGPATGMGNNWNGSLWGGSNYGIYTVNSTAATSPLYVIGGGPGDPPNLWGNPIQTSYFNIPPLNVTGTSNYNCSSPVAHVSNPYYPNVSHYENALAYYMAETALYRFLHLNDSIRNDPANSYSTFYSSLAGTNIGLLMEVEDSLAVGNFTYAAAALSGINDTNAVESNYKAFYELYITYGVHNFEPTNSTDETHLDNLASLCPGTDGACIHQARALYNLVFKNAPAYPPCSSGGARMAGGESSSEGLNRNWQLDLFPNPASNHIRLVSTAANETISVAINDLSGRTVLKQEVKLNGNFVNLELNLSNGAYVVTITNSTHGVSVKKLIIAK